MTGKRQFVLNKHMKCSYVPGHLTKLLKYVSVVYIEGFMGEILIYVSEILLDIPGPVVQSVTCLTADTCLTAVPGVASSIPARSDTFAKIDREIISAAILLPSNDSRRVVVSYKRKYVHEVLVNCLVKLAQEKVVR